MQSNKILHIKNCYFNLPDNFNGTLGEALMLMANRLIQAEAYREVRKSECCDLYQHLMESDRSKCIMEYEVIDAE